MSLSLKTQATSVDMNKIRNLFEKYYLDKRGVLGKKQFIKIMTRILGELGENLQEISRSYRIRFKRFDFHDNKMLEFIVL